MEIYHSIRTNAAYEQLLLHQLRSQYVNETFYDEQWHPDHSLLTTPVKKDLLVSRLDSCHLPISRKNKAKSILTKPYVPDDIRVATVPDAISFDFALIENNRPILLIEVQEKQHRTLSVSRPTCIYNRSGWPVEVPRFIQRLVRDVWRLQVAKAQSLNYLILWFDWLDANRDHPIRFSQQNGQIEFAKNGKFRISELI